MANYSSSVKSKGTTVKKNTGTGTGSVTAESKTNISNLVSKTQSNNKSGNQGGNQGGNTSAAPSSSTIVASPGMNSTNNYNNYNAYDDYDTSDYEDELKSLYSGTNNAYAQALAAQKAATAAGVEKATNSLNAQKEDVNNEYADMYRQLYIDKMNNQKNIGQQMAAAGQTGGQAESTLLGLNTDYEEALRQGKQAQTNAISTLDQAITDAALSGSAADAQATADAAINSANSYASVLQNLINNANTKASLAQSANDTNKQYAYNTALAILQGGNMASDELLNAAGISKTDAATIVANANASKSSSGSYSGNSGSSYSTEQKDILRTAFYNGNRSASIISQLEEAYGQPISVLASAWGINYTPTVQTQTVTPTTKSSGLGSSLVEERAGNYSTVAQNAAYLYQTQGKQAALNYIKEAYSGSTQILNAGDYQKLYKEYSNK